MLGLYWSWQEIGSPGMFTRVACCDMKHLKVTESACLSRVPCLAYTRAAASTCALHHKDTHVVCCVLQHVADLDTNCSNAQLVVAQMILCYNIIYVDHYSTGTY